MGPTTNIRELVEPVVTQSGLELWDVEVSAGMIRVLVDRPEGVDLDTLSELSRQLSTVLDDHDEVAPSGRYQLEVTSPGLERTLRAPWQYRRYLETPISVKTTEPLHGSRRWRGTLVDVDDLAVTLAPELGSPPVPAGPGGEQLPLRIPHGQIQRSRTVFEWGADRTAQKRQHLPGDAAGKKDTAS